MSERGGGAGTFLLGVALGTVLGLLFAPGAGEETRAELARRLRAARDLAGDKADELRARLESGDEEEGEEGEGGEARSARRELGRRLADARERRRSRRVTRRGAQAAAEEEDEPVA